MDYSGKYINRLDKSPDCYLPLANRDDGFILTWSAAISKWIASNAPSLYSLGLRTTLGGYLYTVMASYQDEQASELRIPPMTDGVFHVVAGGSSTTQLSTPLYSDVLWFEHSSFVKVWATGTDVVLSGILQSLGVRAGAVYGVPGREITLALINQDSDGFTLTITHDDSVYSSSTSRILCPGDEDLVVVSGQIVRLIYDMEVTAWRVVSVSGGSVGGWAQSDWTP